MNNNFNNYCIAIFSTLFLFLAFLTFLLFCFLSVLLNLSLFILVSYFCLEAAHTAAQVEIAGLREELLISRTYTEGLLVQLGELQDCDRKSEREKAGFGEGLRRALATQKDEVKSLVTVECCSECGVV